MKNMKKLLAVGAVLAMGTMAIGAADNVAEFDVLLNVVQPLTIQPGGDIDFKTRNLNDLVGGERASQTFTVSGGRDLAVDFAITAAPLKNENGDLVNFTAFNSDAEKGNDIGKTITLDPEGNYSGYLVVELDKVTELGNYAGIVNLEATYN